VAKDAGIRSVGDIQTVKKSRHTGRQGENESGPSTDYNTTAHTRCAHIELQLAATLVDCGSVGPELLHGIINVLWFIA